ncbi:hypothetical protein OC834_002476 [Tilletia horrida]|uniref:Major facilitator superfamily (MFS) profile domain-containing protein n=1 Tax=Tilletia horrida TaxID=155126 RepID=A0AAN6JKF8_9BASI|nr:hypothetical protein OC842_003805 [Tilletia horrida]KAK0532752.1 hypothetical protein OC834_002476 [Tilletia horrida]KAK0534563.1 hypothetical protein OC835_002645 [Tilletia horrida]KAK0562387.1 hypothetical protein OC844_002727 [Tilletia horrida]
MAWGSEGMDAWQGAGAAGPLALVEKQHRSPIGLTWGEVKLLVIAGVGFLMDAYDLFVVNVIYNIVLLVYYPAGTKNLDWGLDGGVFKASANLGNVIGQVGFGLLGDMFGRSAVYGKELLIVIVAVILIISAPDYLGKGVTYWIFAFRVFMGVGIGGDYPMSATIVSDRAYMKKRGALLGWIFSNQGWGNLSASLVAVVVIAAYKGPVLAGDYHKLSGAWRILQGVSLVPAFGVLYFRLTMVESTRFTQARAIQDNPDLIEKIGPIVGNDGDDDLVKADRKEPGSPDTEHLPNLENKAAGLTGMIGEKAHNEFSTYFSLRTPLGRKHAWALFGCAFTWFLVDITFYGINLNTTAILQSIGFTDGHGATAGAKTYSKLMKTATGNLIIVAAGFLPGYFFTIATVEIVGRRAIQMLGFAMNCLFLGILAGKFDTLKHQTAPFFVVFVFLQLFFNFGANATTFIIPAEAFPTRVRAGAHGLCAAIGKLGAILASLLFSRLSQPKGTPGYSGAIGTQNVFWIFFAISVLGLIITIIAVPETKGFDADEVDRQELAALAKGQELPAEMTKMTPDFFKFPVGSHA